MIEPLPASMITKVVTILGSGMKKIICISNLNLDSFVLIYIYKLDSNLNMQIRHKNTYIDLL